MSKTRKNTIKLREVPAGYEYTQRFNDGKIYLGDGDVNPNLLEVTWQDFIDDGAPSKPIYTSVLRSAFQWKARYGTPEARQQHEESLLRRATLARNRALRRQYYDAVDRYRSFRSRLIGSYNPYTGVLSTISVPMFKHCINMQTKHKVLYGGTVALVTSQSLWQPWGSISYMAFRGSIGNVPPFFYKDRITLADKFGECFRMSQLKDETISRIISSRILNDTRLLNIKGGKFSLLTFFAELSDLKHLPSLLKKWTRTSHDISEKFLGVNFGVLPFYSDICAILDRLNNLPYAIDEWNRAASSGEIRRYHCTIDPNKVDALYDATKSKTYTHNHVVGTHNNAAVYMYASTTLTEKVKIRGHVYLQPRVIPDDRIVALKRHIWGTDTPLATAWEKIPFSFVVDWFLHLGDLIQEIEEVDDILSYRIVDAGFSCKVESTWTTTHGSQPFVGDLVTLQSSSTYYIRRPLSPNSFGKPEGEPFTLTGLNVKQGLLSAALIHQQLKR